MIMNLRMMIIMIMRMIMMTLMMMLMYVPSLSVWSNYLNFFRKTDRILLKMHRHVHGRPLKSVVVVHRRMPRRRCTRKKLRVFSGYQIMQFHVVLVVKLNSGLDEENIIVGAHFNINVFFCSFFLSVSILSVYCLITHLR